MAEGKNIIPVVYVVTLEGVKNRCKIGVTGDLDKRVSQLSVASPFNVVVRHEFRMKTMDDAYEAERKIHDELKEHRVKGEWFAVSIETARNIAREITRAVNGGVLGPEYFIPPVTWFGKVINGSKISTSRKAA